jgi:dihydroneopterin aldolase
VTQGPQPLTATYPFPRPPADSSAKVGPSFKVEALRVFVRGLRIEAQIGVYDHEHGRGQPLVIDVQLEIAAAHCEHIADTVNYESIVTMARAVAAERHWKLVEAFAERLAESCLTDPRVGRVHIRVEKPEALAPDASAAGVEIVMTRA